MVMDDDFEAKVEVALAAMPDDRPRYTTARLRREVDEAKRTARIYALEEAAKVAEAMPALRAVSAVHVKSTAPKDVAAAIRQLMKETP